MASRFASPTPNVTRAKVRSLDDVRKRNRDDGRGSVLQRNFTAVSGEKMEISEDVTTTRRARVAIAELLGSQPHNIFFIGSDGEALTDDDHVTCPVTVAVLP